MSILFLKGSFEDEGLNMFEVQILSSFAKEHKLPLAFKIGGCEAKSDIVTALNYGATCVVAPMVESEFAVRKFINATEPHISLLKERNINIETITAVENIEKILKTNHKFLNGIVVGRSDLALSMGLQKKDVDSSEVMEQVKKALVVAKKYGLITTMGGSVSTNSIPRVYHMFESNLLDRFETRKAIIKITHDNEQNCSFLEEAFSIETNFLDRTLINYESGQSAAKNRSKSIKERKLRS